MHCEFVTITANSFGVVNYNGGKKRLDKVKKSSKIGQGQKRYA